MAAPMPFERQKIATTWLKFKGESAERLLKQRMAMRYSPTPDS
jgi:hypothetical protein